PEVFDRRPRRPQRDPGVEQMLDHLELDQISIGVEPLGPTPPRVRDGWADQVGARPVVELAVRDPHDLADLWTSKAGHHHRSRASSGPLVSGSSGTHRGVVTQCELYPGGA